MTKGKQVLPIFKRNRELEMLKLISKGINYNRHICKKLNLPDNCCLHSLHRLRMEGFIKSENKIFELIDEDGTKIKFHTHKNIYNIKFYKLTSKGENVLDYIEEREQIEEKYKELLNNCKMNKKKIHSLDKRKK